MATRTAKAHWEGTLKEGKGTMALGSGAFEGQYSFSSRFEEGNGTNPEELLGAAHAGCFTMALNAGLERAGHTPDYIRTTASVYMERINDVLTISKVVLTTEGKVPGIDQATFEQYAEDSKKTCIISRALNIPTMEVHATLIS